jgi:lysophospholipase L1-like esterase
VFRIGVPSQSGAWRALIALAAAALGFGSAQAVVALQPEAQASRWTLGESSVPIEVAALAGDLPPRSDALDLWSYRAASPALPAFEAGTVDLDALVPDGGQLSVRLGAEAVGGPARPVRPPLDSPGVEDRPGPGPSPGPGRRPGEAARPPSHDSPRGKPPDRGAGVLIDRGARGQIVGRGLSCAPAAAPKAPAFHLGLTARQGIVEVRIDGALVTQCRGSWSAGALVLASGVRRVQVDDFALTPEGGAPFRDDFGSPLLVPTAGLVTALIFGALSWVGARRLAPAAWRSVGLALSPLLALPLLAALPLRGVLDALRLLEVPEPLGPFVFASIPAAIALSIATGALAASKRRAALVGLAPLVALLVAFLVALATRIPNLPDDTLGLTILAGLGAPLALLAYQNTHPTTRRVSTSYALTLLILCGAEFGLRHTALDKTWTATAGWRRASQEFTELLKIREYRTYPDEGFPVRPPEPDPTRKRIVALGGSSTGGAYQMDDIDQFWPRRLQDRLPGWQVVNQGVGGWNTLHVRLYMESQIERLDADIYALYIGHNDILSSSPVPYRQLYASWSAPDGWVRATSEALNRTRLYVGLKYTILALSSRKAAVAVPVPDARENIAAIIAAAHSHGARVLLVTEGLNPDPYPMAPYGEMLASLAEATGSGYLDAASAFAKEDPDLFLDDCHLSVEGHEALAGWINAKLRADGWL